jgi:PhnB protein
MYMPPGFNTVTPYFFVADAGRFVTFLVQGLGGMETCRTQRPDGTIQNVIVQLGTSAVMVSEATGKYPPMAAAYYVYVEDADAARVACAIHTAISGGFRSAWCASPTGHKPRRYSRHKTSYLTRPRPS